MAPRILILHVSGTNRDRDVAVACEMAGGAPEVVHVNQLRDGTRRWSGFDMLVLPGGFAYGDALGAGRLTALDLRAYFAAEVAEFVASGKPVIGICNGFQALVKAGLLPGATEAAESRNATLARNARGHFECRWVTLLPQPESPCIFTRGLSEPIYCPVAHGEGNFIPGDAAALAALRANGQIALTYARVDDESEPAAGQYPGNPNGSVADIAGVCNPAGNVLGLMPHPENHIFPWQHPRWTRGEFAGLGLALFTTAIRRL
jgi:phosphoribosylformylglycinamidine synthase